MKFWGVRLGSVVIALAACLALDAIAQHENTYIQRLILLAGLFVTLAVSLNLINGITGQFSIGHAAFYQVGAYVTGYLATTYFQKVPTKPGLLLTLHTHPALWLVLMMIAGAIGASIAGLIVGLPSLRLRGDYLAIVTLGFGEIIRIVAQNQPQLGGSYGLPVTPQFQYIWLVWMLAIICIAVSRNMLKSAHGLAFLAVREDEIASLAMGVNVTRVKVTAFLIGSAFAGAAGALYAHFIGFISPATFSMDVSFLLVTMVVLGGTGSITGTAIAAVLLFYLPEKMRDFENVPFSIVTGSALALVIMVVAVRFVRDQYHGSRGKSAAIISGIIAASLISVFIFGAILHHVPALSGTVEGSKLRMVVVAATLIVLMLLRPQGMLAHHEFSWAWVQKLFGKREIRA